MRGLAGEQSDTANPAYCVLQTMSKHLLPLAVVLTCCYLGSVLLAIPEGGSCSMTYMWPNYFSLGRMASMGHGYDLYLYKEGQHSFSDARKVHSLSCKA